MKCFYGGAAINMRDIMEKRKKMIERLPGMFLG